MASAGSRSSRPWCRRQPGTTPTVLSIASTPLDAASAPVAVSVAFVGASSTGTEVPMALRAIDASLAAVAAIPSPIAAAVSPSKGTRQYRPAAPFRPNAGLDSSVVRSAATGDAPSTATAPTRGSGFSFKKATRVSSTLQQPAAAAKAATAPVLGTVTEGRPSHRDSDAASRGDAPSRASDTAAPAFAHRSVDLTLHGTDFAEDDVIVNPDTFPGWCTGDYVVIAASDVAVRAADLPRASMTPAGDVEAMTGLHSIRTRAGSASTDVSDASSGVRKPQAPPPRRNSGDACIVMDANGTLRFHTGPVNAADDTTLGRVVPREKCLLARVGTVTASKGRNLQLSLRSGVADTFTWRAKQGVDVFRLSGREEAERLFGLSHVELTFRDQYASRSGMYRFRKALAGMCMYVGQFVLAHGLRMSVKECAAAHDGTPLKPVLSGMVTPETKFTFRTRSSHVVLLLQMSREMWQFDNDGEMYFEKLADRFLATLFAKWAALSATHSLSVILFTRTYYDVTPAQVLASVGTREALELASAFQPDSGGDSGSAATFGHTDVGSTPQSGPQGGSSALTDHALCISPDGRVFEDFYWPLVEDFVMATGSGGASSATGAATSGPTPSSGAASSTPSAAAAASSGGDWHKLLRTIKRAFKAFPVHAHWGAVTVGAASRPHARVAPTAKAHMTDVVEGSPSLASHGNLLEAINLCLNIFQRHHMDRDLYRMGQNITVLTAGNGSFEVDPSIAQMTKQRMMDSGISCDIVCMSRPPLFNVPLFITKARRYASATDVRTGVAKQGVAPADVLKHAPVSVTVAFSMPHWVHCSFFGHVSHSYTTLMPVVESQAALRAMAMPPPASSGTPSPITANNAFLSEWRAHARGINSSTCAVMRIMDVLFRTPTSLTGTFNDPSEGPCNDVSALQLRCSDSGGTLAPFFPIPVPRLFALYTPRLSPNGPTYPPALLEILRRIGRTYAQDARSGDAGITRPRGGSLGSNVSGSEAQQRTRRASVASSTPSQDVGLLVTSSTGTVVVPRRRAVAETSPHGLRAHAHATAAAAGGAPGAGYTGDKYEHEDVALLPSNSPLLPVRPAGSYAPISDALLHAFTHMDVSASVGHALSLLSPIQEAAVLAPYTSSVLPTGDTFNTPPLVAASPAVEEQGDEDSSEQRTHGTHASDDRDGYADTVRSDGARMLGARVAAQLRHTGGGSTAQAPSRGTRAVPASDALAHKSLRRTRSWRAPGSRSPFLPAASGAAVTPDVLALPQPPAGIRRNSSTQGLVSQQQAAAAAGVSHALSALLDPSAAAASPALGATVAIHAGALHQLRAGTAGHADIPLMPTLRLLLPNKRYGSATSLQSPMAGALSPMLGSAAGSPTALDMLPRAVGIAGHDGFGYVVVEASLPGVAADLIRKVPRNEDLYPWNVLLARLSRRITQLTDAPAWTLHAASKQRGSRSGATNELFKQLGYAGLANTVRATARRAAIRSRRPRDGDRRATLFDAYSRHDATVFSRRSCSSIVASPSVGCMSLVGGKRTASGILSPSTSTATGTVTMTVSTDARPVSKQYTAVSAEPLGAPRALPAHDPSLVFASPVMHSMSGTASGGSSLLAPPLSLTAPAVSSHRFVCRTYVRASAPPTTFLMPDTTATTTSATGAAVTSSDSGQKPSPSSSGSSGVTAGGTIRATRAARRATMLSRRRSSSRNTLLKPRMGPDASMGDAPTSATTAAASTTVTDAGRSQRALSHSVLFARMPFFPRPTLLQAIGAVAASPLLRFGGADFSSLRASQARDRLTDATLRVFDIASMTALLSAAPTQHADFSVTRTPLASSLVMRSPLMTAAPPLPDLMLSTNASMFQSGSSGGKATRATAGLTAARTPPASPLRRPAGAPPPPPIAPAVASDMRQLPRASVLGALPGLAAATVLSAHSAATPTPRGAPSLVPAYAVAAFPPLDSKIGISPMFAIGLGADTEEAHSPSSSTTVARRARGGSATQRMPSTLARQAQPPPAVSSSEDIHTTSVDAQSASNVSHTSSGDDMAILGHMETTAPPPLTSVLLPLQPRVPAAPTHEESSDGLRVDTSSNSGDAATRAAAAAATTQGSVTLPSTVVHTTASSVDDSRAVAAEAAAQLSTAFVHIPGVTAPSTQISSAGGLVNPFRRRAGDIALATANRRRWWHMFPAEQLAEQQFTTPTTASPSASAAQPAPTRSLIDTLEAYLPNWKSLCEPAIMPLTTDFLPSNSELTATFSESNYELVLPLRISSDMLPVIDLMTEPHTQSASPSALASPADDDGAAAAGPGDARSQSPDAGVPTTTLVTSKKQPLSGASTAAIHAAIVEEMVCQRLVQDFQLVVGDAATSIALDDSHKRPGHVVFVLTMGHRIHTIIHDTAHATVTVKMYSKKTSTSVLGTVRASMQGGTVPSILTSPPLPALPSATYSSSIARAPPTPAHGPSTALALLRSSHAPPPAPPPPAVTVSTEGQVADTSASGSSAWFQADLSASQQSLTSSAPRLPEGAASSQPASAPASAARTQGTTQRVPVDAVASATLRARTQQKQAAALTISTATAVSTLARDLAPAFVDIDGVCVYRYALFCPFRGRAVSTCREFRMPAASAKATGLQTHTTVNASMASGAGSLGQTYASRTFVSSVRGTASLHTPHAGSVSGATALRSHATPVSRGASPSLIATPSGAMPLLHSLPPAGGSTVAQSSTLHAHAWESEFNWNHLDGLLTGEAQDLTDNVRHKRISLLLLPQVMQHPMVSSHRDAVLRCIAFERFWSHVHNKMPGNDAGAPPSGASGAKGQGYIPVCVFIPPCDDVRAAVEAGDANRGRNESFLSAASGSNRDRSASTTAHALRLLSTTLTDDSDACANVRVDLRARGPAPFEWLQVEYGRVYNPTRAFPITLRWIIASNVAVESLVTALHRRARQSGFTLVQVPEYARRVQGSGGTAHIAGPPRRLSAPRASPAVHPPRESEATSVNDAGAFPSFTLPVPLSISANIMAEIATAGGRRGYHLEPGAAAATQSSNQMLVGALHAEMPLLYLLENMLVRDFGFVAERAVTGLEAPPLRAQPPPSRSRLSSVGGLSAAIGAVLNTPLLQGSSGAAAQRMTLEEAHALHASASGPAWFRQYVHASGAVFIRIHASGVTWLHNRIPPSRIRSYVSSSNSVGSLSYWAARARARTRGNGNTGTSAHEDSAAGVDSSEDAEDVHVARVQLFRELCAACDALAATHDVLNDLLTHVSASVAPAHE